jgi:hypothetical protein
VFRCCLPCFMAVLCKYARTRRRTHVWSSYCHGGSCRWILGDSQGTIKFFFGK